VRTAGIWIFGLLASGIFGAIVGDWLARSGEGGFFGFLGGAFAFACARLWLHKPRA
jgi:hypothetical protein